MIFFKNKTNNGFNLLRFTSGTCIFGVLHTALICTILVPFFKDSGMLPLQISLLFVAKRVVRLSCDIFFGLIFDRFGAKFVFAISRLCKLLSFVVLLFGDKSFKVLVLAMLLDGISYSSIYGKISSFIYNSLSANTEIKKYPKVMCIYYLSMNATLSLMSFFAGALLKFGFGYNVIILISICTNLLSFVLLFTIIPSTKELKIDDYSSKSIYSAIKTISICIREKPQFMCLVLMYALTSYFGWQCGAIKSMILLDMGVSSSNLAFLGTIQQIVMGVGCITPIIFFKNGISLKKCLILLSIIVFLLLSSAITYSIFVFLLFAYFAVSVYAVVDVSIEKNFEFYSDKKVRGTAISIAMTFCSLLGFVSQLLIGFVAQYFNYSVAIKIYAFLIVAIICYIWRLFRKCKLN